jgi:hypothetical protein
LCIKTVPAVDVKIIVVAAVDLSAETKCRRMTADFPVSGISS